MLRLKAFNVICVERILRQQDAMIATSNNYNNENERTRGNIEVKTKVNRPISTQRIKKSFT